MEIITVEFLMNPSSACAIRQRCTEQDFQAEILGRGALSTPAEAPLEAVPAGEAPSSTSCLGGTPTTSTAWEAASSSRSKGVSVADVGVKAATGGCNGDNLQTSRGIRKHLVPCADASIKEDIEALLGKGFEGRTEEIAGDKGIRETFQDPLDAAEAVAEEAQGASAQGASVAAEPMAAQDEESLEGQSPFGTTHLSETSTVALSPSESLLRDAGSMDHVFICLHYTLQYLLQYVLFITSAIF